MGVRGLKNHVKRAAEDAGIDLITSFGNLQQALDSVATTEASPLPLVLVDAKGIFYGTYRALCMKTAFGLAGRIRWRGIASSYRTNQEASEAIHVAFWRTVGEQEQALVRMCAGKFRLHFVWDRESASTLAKASEDLKRRKQRIREMIKYESHEQKLALWFGGEQAGAKKRGRKSHLPKDVWKAIHVMQRTAWTKHPFPRVELGRLKGDLSHEVRAPADRPHFNGDQGTSDIEWREANPQVLSKRHIVALDEADNLICNIARSQSSNVCVYSADSDFIARESSEVITHWISPVKSRGGRAYEVLDKRQLAALDSQILSDPERLKVAALAAGHDYTGSGLSRIGWETMEKDPGCILADVGQSYAQMIKHPSQAWQQAALEVPLLSEALSVWKFCRHLPANPAASDADLVLQVRAAQTEVAGVVPPNHNDVRFEGAVFGPQDRQSGEREAAPQPVLVRKAMAPMRESLGGGSLLPQWNLQRKEVPRTKDQSTKKRSAPVAASSRVAPPPLASTDLPRLSLRWSRAASSDGEALEAQEDALLAIQQLDNGLAESASVDRASEAPEEGEGGDSESLQGVAITKPSTKRTETGYPMGYQTLQDNIFGRTVDTHPLRQLTRQEEGGFDPVGDMARLFTLYEKATYPIVEAVMLGVFDKMVAEPGLVGLFLERWARPDSLSSTLQGLVKACSEQTTSSTFDRQAAEKKVAEHHVRWPLFVNAGDWIRKATGGIVACANYNLTDIVQASVAEEAKTAQAFAPLLNLPKEQRHAMCIKLATNLVVSYKSNVIPTFRKLANALAATIDYRGITQGGQSKVSLRSGVECGVLRAMLVLELSANTYADVESQIVTVLTRQQCDNLAPELGRLVGLIIRERQEARRLTQDWEGSIKCMLEDASNLTRIGLYLHRVRKMQKQERGAVPTFAPDWVDIQVDTLASLTTSKEYPAELVDKLNKHVLPVINTFAKTHFDGLRHKSSLKPSQDALGDLDKLSCFSHTAQEWSTRATLGRALMTNSSMPNLVLNEQWSTARRNQLEMWNKIAGGESLVLLKHLGGRRILFLDLALCSWRYRTGFVPTGMVSCDGFALQVNGINASRPCLTDLKEQARREVEGKSTRWLFEKLSMLNADSLCSQEKMQTVNFNLAREYMMKRSAPVNQNVLPGEPGGDAAEGAERRAKRERAAIFTKCGLTYDASTRETQLLESGTHCYDRLSGASRPKLVGRQSLRPGTTLRGLPKSIRYVKQDGGGLPKGKQIGEYIFVGDDPGEAFAHTFAIHRPQKDSQRVTSLKLSPHGLQDITRQHQQSLARKRAQWVLTGPPAVNSESARRGLAMMQCVLKSSSDYRQCTWLASCRRAAYNDRAAAQFFRATGASSGKGDRQKVLLAVGDSGGKRSGVRRGAAHLGNSFIALLHKRAQQQMLPVTFVRVDEAWSSQCCPNSKCLRPPDDADLAGSAEEAAGSHWIRSKAWEGTYKDSKQAFRRVLRCERCCVVRNRDVLAASNIAFAAWHELVHGQSPFASRADAKLHDVRPGASSA